MATEASPLRNDPDEPQFNASEFWTKEEVELFERATLHEQFTKNTVWKKLKAFLDTLVEDAQAEMRANKSPKPEDAFYLQAYWREREHVRDLIVAMVYAPIRDRDSIIEDLKEQQKRKQEEALIYARRNIEAD